jgi:hypothetical protein
MGLARLPPAARAHSAGAAPRSAEAASREKSYGSVRPARSGRRDEASNWSGYSAIVVSRGDPPFLVGQVRIPDQNDEGEVVADRTVLEPEPAEANGLD